MPLITKFRVKYFLSACGWLILFLAGTELFMRLLLVSSLPLNILRKGNVFDVWGIEGYGITRYLPDAEIRTPFDRGDYSVVVLGNSFTMARQVMDWQSYASVAETRLNENGFQADIHNLGINGLTLPSYIARSSFVLERYKPDIIVVQVSSGDFLSTGFQAAMRGGHFEHTADGGIVLAQPPSSDFLLPEQMESEITSANILDYSSIYGYLSYKKRATAPAEQSDVAPGQYDETEIIAQELQLFANAYGDTPIVFIVIPSNINFRKRLPYYKNSERDELIINSITQNYPDWKVIYPAQEFNQLLSMRYAPRGFNNAEPFQGHLNANGHRVVGELLAQVLESMLK